MKIVSFEQFKRMTYHKHLAILIFSTIVLMGMGASCKDKNPPAKGYCELVNTCETILEAKDYFLFNMGSWWVYEEDATHERDSVYVTSSSGDPDGPDFDCYLHSQLYDFDYHYFPIVSSASGCSNTGLSGNKCIYVKRAKYQPGNFVGEEHCFFIQYKKGDQVETTNTVYWNDVITVSDIHATYTLDSLTFGRTVKIHEGHTFIENNNQTNHYFSKGVGLIRKELIDSNQVWNLVNYHIEP